MIFRKKKESKGYYVVIDYTDQAKELCVSGSQNLKIIHYYDDYPIKEESYSSIKEKFLRRNGIIIVPLYQFRSVQKASIEGKNIIEHSLSTIEFVRKKYK